MSRKLVHTVLLTLVIVSMTLSLGRAAEEWISGRVLSVDANSGSLIITTDDNKLKRLSVPKELLRGVKPGHDVDVNIVDGKVKNLENYSTES